MSNERKGVVNPLILVREDPSSKSPHDVTLRDLFAAAALAGMLSDHHFLSPGSSAQGAYSMADAMLKERAK